MPAMIGGSTASVWLVAAPLLLLAMLWGPSACHAHGYLSTPPSRQAQCAQGKVSGCGSIIYEPQSVEALKGKKTCNGDIANWAPLADDSKAWVVASMSKGVNTFRWTLTAVHATASWEYYIGGTRVAFITGASTTHSVDLSAYSGRQKILAIWNIGDTANAFYACVDVNVGGSGGVVTPTTAPTSAPTTTPTRAPTTTAPTSAPLPTSTPIRGTVWYTVRAGDSLGAIAAARGITLASIIAVNPEITDPNLIYVSQRIRLPSKSASAMNGTEEEATGGFGFSVTGSDGSTAVELTDNAVDLTSTGVGSHWYAGIQKALSGAHASSAHAAATPATLMLGVTLLSVVSLLIGQS